IRDFHVTGVQTCALAICSYVAREITLLGGHPALRQDFVTDNGNVILDVHGLQIMNPVELETTLNQIAGVVTNGLFARKGANILRSEERRVGKACTCRWSP